MKRTTEEVLVAIEAAGRAGQGRILANVDPLVDEADLQARAALTVRLRGYDGRGLVGANEIAEAERRFRRALEQALGGPQQLLAAFQAIEFARENALEGLPAHEQDLVRRWATAAARVRAEGIQNLPPVSSTAAWFELKPLRQRDHRAPARAIVEAREPPTTNGGQAELF